MKNYKFYLVALSLLFVGNADNLFSQNGMDYSGPAVQRYSSLRQFGGFFGQIINNEKALAVYNSQALLPSSQLEVNSTNNYTPFLHPNLGGDRGLVFRT